MKLIPKRTDFYRLFLDQASLIHEASRLLLDASQAGAAKLADSASEIERLELRADTIIHEISNRLKETFITPLDPEDIHRLAHALDDVIDGIEDAAHHMALYRLDPMPKPAVELCRVIDGCAGLVHQALSQMEKEGVTGHHTLEINRLEDEADRIYRRALSDLFATQSDAIALLKEKEIYEYLEVAIDRCEDVADLLENVAVKNG